MLGESSAVDVVVDWYGVADLTLPPAQTPPSEEALQPPPELFAPGDSWSAGKTTTRTPPPVRSATSRRRLRRSCSCTARPTRSWGTSTVRCLLEP